MSAVPVHVRVLRGTEALSHETVSANAEIYLAYALSSFPHCRACNKT